MDATKHPLAIPPEYGVYAEKHELFDLYKRLLSEVLIHKPEDPITFLIDLLKKDNDDVPNVIILGGPATGKFSLGKSICAKLRTAHLTKKNLIEEADVSLKSKVQQYIANNQPIPTDLWTEIIVARVKLFDCVKKGWVMSGFPENREQALSLQSFGISPKHFILLDCQDTVLLERAVGKRIDPKTGDVYHLTFEPPVDEEVEARLQEPAEYTEKELVTRLVNHHRNIDGLITAYKKVHKTINADQPKSDIFAQGMSFLGVRQRSEAPHIPRIVLLGPTGAGKSLQSSLIASKYNIVSVSSGQLVKQAIADGTKLGQACKPYVSKGILVPDPIIMSILKESLSKLDCVSRGWVLRGYPCTREQAEQLEFAGFRPNRVFFLDVSTDSIVERLTLRRTDPITGERYHELYNPPRTRHVRDRLRQHPDDAEPQVRARAAQAQMYADELQDYYAAQQQAQSVNGDQDPHTVFECIESLVVNPLPKRLP